MQCPVCKKPLPDGVEKCRWCGTDLRRASFSKKVAVLLVILLGAGISSFWLHKMARSGPEVSPKGLFPNESNGAIALPDSLDSLVREANGYLMARDCEGAVGILEKILGLRPDAAGFLLLGKCLLELHRGSEAWNAFDSARTRGSQDSQLDSFFAKADQLRKEDQEMGKLQSAHFELWVEGKGLTWNAADTLLPALEAFYDQFCLAWNHYPATKFAVVLYDDPRFRGAELPSWSGAEFDGKIRIPYGILLGWPKNRRILAHELSHAFVHDISGSSVAPWLDEGIAQHFDGTELQWNQLQTLGIASLEDLQKPFISHANPVDAERLYQSSLGLFEVLFRDYARQNMQSIFALLKGLREGVPLEEQMQSQLQVTFVELHQKLSQKIKTTVPENVSENHDSRSQESP